MRNISFLGTNNNNNNNKTHNSQIFKVPVRLEFRVSCYTALIFDKVKRKKYGGRDNRLHGTNGEKSARAPENSSQRP